IRQLFGEREYRSPSHHTTAPERKKSGQRPFFGQRAQKSLPSPSDQPGDPLYDQTQYLWKRSRSQNRNSIHFGGHRPGIHVSIQRTFQPGSKISIPLRVQKKSTDHIPKSGRPRSVYPTETG